MKTVFVLIGPGGATPGKREPGTGGGETSRKIEADSIAAGGSAASRPVPGPSGRIRISDIHARKALHRRMRPQPGVRAAVSVPPPALNSITE